MQIGQSSLQGIQASLKAFERHAKTLSAPESPSGQDMVRGLTGLKMSAASFQANVKAWQVQDECLGTLLDVMA